MSENERQQRMAERILEDERLRGDLTDDAATALIEWASRQASDAAADPARPDEAVEADIERIRRATRAAAKSGLDDPQQVVALAIEQLQQSAAPSAPADAPGDSNATPAPADSAAAPATSPSAPAPADSSSTPETAVQTQAEAQPSAPADNSSTPKTAVQTQTEIRPSTPAEAPSDSNAAPSTDSAATSAPQLNAVAPPAPPRGQRQRNRGSTSRRKRRRS